MGIEELEMQKYTIKTMPVRPQGRPKVNVEVR